MSPSTFKAFFTVPVNGEITVNRSEVQFIEPVETGVTLRMSHLNYGSIWARVVGFNADTVTFMRLSKNND